MAGCAEGALHVWKWESATEVSHIPAHSQRIHHCSILPSKGNLPVAKHAQKTPEIPILVIMMQTDRNRSLRDIKRDSIVNKLQIK